MSRRGRPPGLILNGAAVEDLLGMRHLSKSQLCLTAQVSPGHLADMLHRAKGGSGDVVRRLAASLGCSEATLAPELAGFLARDRMRGGGDERRTDVVGAPDIERGARSRT